jgi:hypothetical protein
LYVKKAARCARTGRPFLILSRRLQTDKEILMTVYTVASTPIKVRIRDSEVDAVVALAAEQRTQLKTIIKFCREIERNRYADARDKRCAARMRHMHSAMLALSRAGCRS